MNLSNSVIGSLMILNELDLLPRWIFVKLQFDEMNDGREPVLLCQLLAALSLSTLVHHQRQLLHQFKVRKLCDFRVALPPVANDTQWALLP